MTLLLLLNPPVPAETGTSSIVLSGSGVEVSDDFVAASGRSSIVATASAVEAIADRNESVFDGGVFDPSVFDVGLSIRLRPSGVGERVGGGIVVGGGLPQFVLEPVRRRGTATIRLLASGAQRLEWGLELADLEAIALLEDDVELLAVLLDPSGLP